MKKAFTIPFCVATILILSFSAMTISCKVAPPEQRAIRQYLKEILNDPKSYEPVDFKTLNFEENFDSLGINFWQYEAAKSSLWDETNHLVVNLCVADDKSLQSDALVLWDSVKAVLNYSTIDYSNYESINNLLSFCNRRTVELITRVYKNYDAVGKLTLFEIRKGTPKFSAALKTYNEVDATISDKIRDLCIPLNQVKQTFDAGRVLIHSFRAKNSFGALILSQKVFILRTGKTEVQCSIDIDNLNPSKPLF